jgi:hypothetical protein
MRRGVKISGILMLAASVGLVAWAAAGANRREGFEMTWRYGPPAKEYPASRHIILTFVKFPDHYIGIYSPDLGDYLKSLPSDRVRVTFEISPIFGGMHGGDWLNPFRLFELVAGRLRGRVWYNAVQIGELTRWRSEGGYGGARGNPHSSPRD